MFPGLPRFSRSSASVCYTERKPKNKKRGRPGNEASDITCELVPSSLFYFFLLELGNSEFLKYGFRSLVGLGLRLQLALSHNVAWSDGRNFFHASALFQ